MGKAARQKGVQKKESRQEQVKKPQQNWVKDVLQIILLAFVMAMAVKLLLVDTRSIPSTSMVPTIEVGDRVVMSRLSYLGDKSPQRGDIVVFKAPDELGERSDLIKRVIATAGETVEVKSGQVYIDGTAIDEPYLAEAPGYDFGPLTVPKDALFVLGDNRNYSNDAHLWPTHYIMVKDVKGKALWCYWPLSRIGSLYQGTADN